MGGGCPIAQGAPRTPVHGSEIGPKAKLVHPSFRVAWGDSLLCELPLAAVLVARLQPPLHLGRQLCRPLACPSR